MNRTETRLVEVSWELYDSTGAEKILFNRIFPIQIRYGILILVIQRNKSIGKERGNLEGLAHMIMDLRSPTVYCLQAGGPTPET